MIIRRGFTLIELLVVIAIIVVLVGLLVSAAMIVRKKQVVARTRIQIQGLSLAMTSYLSDYGIVGDQRVENPDDFADRPAEYLLLRPTRSGRRPYISGELYQFGDATGNPIAVIADARTIVDPFGEPLAWRIVNARSSPSQGFDHTAIIEIRSTLGTATVDDDLVFSFDLESDNWTWE